MINDIKIEICCGSYEDCLTALEFPVDRIELNSALELGGLTPMLATLQKIKSQSDIPICCMVRNRGGDFCYSEQEFELMLKEGQLLLENGADGLVFGCLKEDETINCVQCSEMVELAKHYRKQIVFHKAFDQTDMNRSIEQLVSLGIDRILTSGGENYPNILQGAKMLEKLNADYGHSIEILPGGGVRKDNICDLLKETNIKQVHMSASVIKKGFKQVDKEKLKGILDCLYKL
ncbi:MAG: copper homeostasis protein CutC [Erysipelotrichia bacterium]|nr:copper homeostasis protein CutC [Erysipelotrichia bacterium]